MKRKSMYEMMGAAIAAGLLSGTGGASKTLNTRNRRERRCRCGMTFIPERTGHYLCPECLREKRMGKLSLHPAQSCSLSGHRCKRIA
jgi:hypothetical protein